MTFGKILFFLVAIPGLLCQTSSNSARVKMGIVLNTGTNLTMDYFNMAPAISLAIERSLQEYQVAFEPFLSLYEGGCQEVGALAQTVRALNNSVDMILGPACTEDLLLAAKLTTSYRVALMTGAGSFLDSTEAWPFVTRTAYNTQTQWSFFGLICRQFNWTNVFITYEVDTFFQKLPAESLMKDLRRRQLTSYNYPVKGSEPFDLRTADVLLQAAALQARVVFLLLAPDKRRLVMVQAQRRGMCFGEYAFFALDPLKVDILAGKGWERHDIYDQEASMAYRAFFVLALRFNKSGAQFQAFEKQVRKRHLTPPGGKRLEVNYYSSTFHDAVLLYAVVLNETLVAGGALTRDNANLINEKLASRTFNGSVGSIHLDKNGDRADDYQLFQMAPPDTSTPNSSGEFVLIGEYFGDKSSYQTVRKVNWLSADNTPVINRPKCGYDGNDPDCLNAARTILAASLGGVFLFLLTFGLASYVIYRLLLRRRELNNLDWLANWNDIFFLQRNNGRINSNRSFVSANSLPLPDANDRMSPQPISTAFFSDLKPSQDFMKSQISVPRSTKTTKESIMKTSTILATFRNSIVLARPCKTPHVELSSKVRVEVRLVRALSCENLTNFVAACLEPGYITVLVEYCSRGTLQDILQNDAISLDWVFRLSFIEDIVGALIYIQGSALQQHGRLSSKCCFINKHFLLKISDFGLPSFYDDPLTAADEPQDLLWTAPEILRSKTGLSSASPEGDVFAFAIILQEIIQRESPYFANNVSAESIVKAIERGDQPPLRPVVQDNFCDQEILLIMSTCWAENPAERLKFVQIRRCLRQLKKKNHREKASIIDTLIEKMEEYAQNLETSVDEKTHALIEEKKKTDQLLYSILPRPIAEKLKCGEPIIPELYDSVTVYFGDIVQFTSLSAISSPTQIVNLMNDLYCQFDQIIIQFDAYKVETIGDCYVIVSGLPHRNDQQHALEIARLATTLRDSMLTFKVRHLPDKVLQLRIGLNSGSCVAGVVGITSPRYCLFGDTVNVASRMESTGEPMKIQISQTTEEILRRLGSFLVEPRGEVKIKGKGQMTTFWLIGENLAIPPV